MTNEEAIEFLSLVKTNASKIDEAIEMSMEALEKQTRHCDNCQHLIVLNGNDIYAECEVNGLKFKSFEVDTRETYCNYWSEVE